MKSEKIVFLDYPNRVVVCESIHSSLGDDPVTHDLYEYARIVKFCQPTNWYETKYEFTGDIEWSKRKDMLSDEHVKEIVAFAANMRENAEDKIRAAKKKQAYNKKLYELQ